MIKPLIFLITSTSEFFKLYHEFSINSYFNYKRVQLCMHLIFSKDFWLKLRTMRHPVLRFKLRFLEKVQISYLSHIVSRQKNSSKNVYVDFKGTFAKIGQLHFKAVFKGIWLKNKELKIRLVGNYCPWVKRSTPWSSLPISIVYVCVCSDGIVNVHYL